MRRWIEGAAKLYPAQWRQRYEHEFYALLADMEPSWRQFFDVLGGALKMQLLSGEALYLKLGVAFALVGITIATAWSFAAPRQYVSSAVLHISPQAQSPLFSAIQVARSRTSLSEVIQRPELDLYRKERFREPLEDTIERMRRDLRIAKAPSQDSSLAIRVEFQYTDPRKARQVVDVFLAKLSGALGSEHLNPSVSTQPVSQNRLAFVGIGFAIGILSGVIAAYFKRNTRRAILLTATGFAGCIAGIGLSFLIADRYISTAVVRIIPTEGQASVSAAIQLQQAAAQILSRTNLSALIERRELNLYAEERRSTPLEDVIQKVRTDLKLDLVRPGQHFGVKPEEATGMEVRFESPDRDKAHAMVMAVTRELTQSGSAKNVEYLDYASLRQSPVFPNRYVISAIGLAFGLIMGAVSIRAVKRRTPAILA